MTTLLARNRATPEQNKQPLEVPSEAVTRLQSRDLFRHGREVEINHEGRIYRLRLTQLNKLILTA
jgi:hemin uptake protein HemP